MALTHLMLVYSLVREVKAEKEERAARPPPPKKHHSLVRARPVCSSLSVVFTVSSSSQFTMDTV